MVPWLPENQRDTRWYLWHPQFMCRVPNIQTMSAEYIKYFGMPSTGIDQYDRQTANEMIYRMLTVNEMVDFFAQGTSIEVCNRADTKTIYEYIKNHLMAWRQELENGFHIRNAPLEELQTLDKFAKVVYEHAQYHFDKPFVDSILARQMGTLVSANRDTIITKKPKALQQAEAPVQPPAGAPGHVSMAEVFASNRAALKPKWEQY